MNYVFDIPELEKKAKRRINLWAVPMWLAKHPAIATFLISTLLGAVFFGLHLLWTPFFLLTFFFWFVAFATVFFGGLWALLEFIDGNGIGKVQEWVFSRYERSQRIED